MTLTKEAREAIAKAVGRLRALFEAEFADQAKGRFGLHAERRPGPHDSLTDHDEAGDSADERLLRPWVEPLSALSLSPSQSAHRSELIGALTYLVNQGLEGGDAVARLVREAAFTAVNRLLAVRVGEAIGVFGEGVSKGRQSAAYRETVQDLFPLLWQAEDEGFWQYLQVAGDELGATVPLLFDRRLPVSAFVPSRSCVDGALAVLNDEEVQDAWAEPEALGWAYQFFNGDDVRVMRASPHAPRNSRELAVRNQFFTPRYVVDWLVQNTLGRRLQQAGYDLDLPLLVVELVERAEIDLDQVRILDPACGSGHFLLGCYDLLEQAWDLEGVAPAEAAPRILNSLFGIDIDPRATQVAQAVLVLRARRASVGVMFEPPAIVTARPLPGSPTVRAAVFDRLSSNARDLAEELDAALLDAPVLGTLLKAEARLATALDRALRVPKLAGEATAEALEVELLDAAEEIARAADASPAARMFGADARDAIRFVGLCQQRYDVVLMNPPFGDPVPETIAYLNAAYPGYCGNLYAAFVLRGMEMLKPGGSLGAITDRNGFFIKTFKDWRQTHVLPALQAMLDLGIGVMHRAMVEAAAYVLSPNPAASVGVFRRLVDEKDKAAATYEGRGEVFTARPTDFMLITDAPTAYWLAGPALALFKTHQALGSVRGVAVKQGLATADDFRFLRLWWEVPASGVGAGRRWRPFAKGGDFSPYYAEISLVVDWEDDGRRIREFGRGRVQNTQFYFRAGLTWPYKSDSGFSVRPIPAGAIFSHKGMVVFVDGDDRARLDRLMAYLNSSIAAALLEPMVAFGKYEAGAVKRIPHLSLGSEVDNAVALLTKTQLSSAARLETSRLFASPWLTAASASPPEVLAASEHVDREALRMAETEGASHSKPLSVTFPTEWLQQRGKPTEAPSAHQELSYLLGVALGRWDVRVANGSQAVPALPTPYDPLPVAARGMRVDADGLPCDTPLPTDGVALPSDSLLVDEPGHTWDVVAAIEAAAIALREGDDEPKVGLFDEVSDLRKQLRSGFFRAHVVDYSGSKRSAPIYWYLSVPSREWGLWAYSPALSREMLFAIAGAARDRLRRLREQVSQLRKQVGEGTRQEADRLEKLEALVAEVESFLESAEAIAQSGWAPDLHDGMVLCAAPLEPLFADDKWRSEVAKHREKLESGGYPWAAVQRDYFGVRT